jgi:heme exporter protein D
MKLSPFLFVTGILLLFALSFLVQLAILKWRHEKREKEKRLAAAQRKRVTKDPSAGN